MGGIGAKRAFLYQAAVKKEFGKKRGKTDDGLTEVLNRGGRKAPTGNKSVVELGDRRNADLKICTNGRAPKVGGGQKFNS